MYDNKFQSHSGENTLSFLKKFDLYSKVDDNYRIKTSSGAGLSLIGWFLIFILVVLEIKNYSVIKVHEHMLVSANMPIYI